MNEELTDTERLNVLEEMRGANRLQLFRLEARIVGVAVTEAGEKARVLVHESFRSAADLELNRRAALEEK